MAASSPVHFTGIPFAALDFYEDLEADNSKSFWSAHKHVYDASVRPPMAALADALAEEFGAAKLFRPYRDVRFSKDKTPYKTHQGAFVGTAPGTGYYAQIDASGLMVAGGFYAASPSQLARLRATIDDDVRGPELEALVSRVRAAGLEVSGNRLKTKPRGYAADHPRIELLRHRSLTAGVSFGSPEWLKTPEAVDHVRDTWRTLSPLVEWLTQVLQELPE
ncbi:DUF2461 domain-containing protein [Tomitella biformata]|uniref:DUF2461 domain-containing protein n=1 Tax=Tomitella biformata TaxID=630403 RepID=UPI0004B37FD9|nr:DUF2461 domain-containing protein [Tomitella biformata]